MRAQRIATEFPLSPTRARVRVLRGMRCDALRPEQTMNENERKRTLMNEQPLRSSAFALLPARCGLGVGSRRHSRRGPLPFAQFALRRCRSRAVVCPWPAQDYRFGSHRGARIRGDRSAGAGVAALVCRFESAGRSNRARRVLASTGGSMNPKVEEDLLAAACLKASPPSVSSMSYTKPTGPNGTSLKPG